MTGLGKRKIVELNIQIKGNKIPEECSGSRGKWERFPDPEHRSLLTNVSNDLTGTKRKEYFYTCYIQSSSHTAILVIIVIMLLTSCILKGMKIN